MAELSLEASDQIMSDAPAVQQKQRSEVPQAPVVSSSKAGASSQGGARVVPELSAPHVQPAAAESHRLSVSVPALDVLGPSKHHPRTPEQYNGLVATQQKAAAASKGKGKIVLMLSDESDYGALSDCVYYSVHNNAIFIGADANRAAAFKYSSWQRAKMPASVVYKFAPRGFLCTPYELEQLYKHYANKHAPYCDRVVAYLLINELLLVVQKLDKSLLDKTMQALLHDPMYRDL
ncbi:hypothetical protein C0995_014881 [Termitomyces sp. Mi166|nr:hypothetical protein C0995_014881 [Termitomyces sp. Mi166\